MSVGEAFIWALAISGMIPLVAIGAALGVIIVGSAIQQVRKQVPTHIFSSGVDDR